MKASGILFSLAAHLFLVRARRDLMDKLSHIYRVTLPLRNSIPRVLERAVILGEDHRFYAHRGFDPIALLRVVRDFLLKGKLGGASTIEQQLVRTITGRYEKTLRRKLWEILLASVVSECIPKTDVPGLYLSVAHFGWGMNGVEAACNRLGFYLPDLTRLQAASLVARLKYPQTKLLTPVRIQQIETRTRHLIGLLENGFAGHSATQLRNVDSHETLLDF